MSVRSIQRLAVHRRPATTESKGAPAEQVPSAASLEAAVPTEIVVFYTTVIAACEAVLSDSDKTLTTFRFWLFVATLLLTMIVSAGMVRHATTSATEVLGSAEWWTATVAFATWGLVVPGSFLYSSLDRDQLVVTVATITAGAGLLLGTGLGPNLGRPVAEGKGRPEAGAITFFDGPQHDEPPSSTATDTRTLE